MEVGIAFTQVAYIFLGYVDHTTKKDDYEAAVKETVQVYDQLIEKLSGPVKSKAIDNLSQRIIQLRQTVHVNNFR